MTLTAFCTATGPARPSGPAPAPGALRWPLLLACGLPVLALLSACGSAPRRGGAEPPGGPPAGSSARYPGRDGPGENPPPNLQAMPDAQPQVENPRSGGPNKPYEVLGQSYVPLRGDPPLIERGLASWYGRKFHGRPTSSGELYDMYAMTAAHRTMPLPSYARVRNPANGREVVVRVNDRGPFHAGRVIDLSYTAALKLGLLRGVAPVEVERLTNEAIRTGSWRQGGATLAQAEAPAETGTALATPSALAQAAPPSPAPGPGPGPADSAAAAPMAQTPPETRLATAGSAPTASAVAATDTGVLPEAAASPGYWLQLGAFRVASGALSFRHQVAEQVDWLAPLLAVFSDERLHRLQAGPYTNRDEALAAADRLRQALQLLPTVVERR